MAKKIVFVLIGLVALTLLVPAFMKPEFRIERSIEIAKPAEIERLELLGNLRP